MRTTTWSAPCCPGRSTKALAAGGLIAIRSTPQPICCPPSRVIRKDSGWPRCELRFAASTITKTIVSRAAHGSLETTVPDVSPRRRSESFSSPAHVRIAMRESVGLVGRTGLLVRAVDPESPVASAGFVAVPDVLVEAGGSALHSATALNTAIQEAGKALIVRYLRGDVEGTAQVRLPGGVRSSAKLGHLRRRTATATNGCKGPGCDRAPKPLNRRSRTSSGRRVISGHRRARRSARRR
jgi:hypothetical protein